MSNFISTIMSPFSNKMKGETKMTTCYLNKAKLSVDGHTVLKSFYGKGILLEQVGGKYRVECKGEVMTVNSTPRTSNEIYITKVD